MLLLAALAAGAAHGYAIITALRERSGGTFDLPEGDDLSRPAPPRTVRSAPE